MSILPTTKQERTDPSTTTKRVEDGIKWMESSPGFVHSVSVVNWTVRAILRNTKRGKKRDKYTKITDGVTDMLQKVILDRSPKVTREIDAIMTGVESIKTPSELDDALIREKALEAIEKFNAVVKGVEDIKTLSQSEDHFKIMLSTERAPCPEMPATISGIVSFTLIPE